MDFPHLTDLHIHSDNSPDGNNSVSHICETAVAKGMEVIAITDHCETDLYYQDNYDQSVTQSFFETRKAIAVFSSYMKVLCGIELGQAVHDLKTADMLLAKRPFDFVIASTHNVKGKRDFYYLDYSHEDIPNLLDRYFDELLETARWNGFDILGHITYPLRYIVGDHGIDVDMSPFREKIDEIFRVTIANGKGIEVNTSGLRQKIGRTLPDAEYVKRFRELGGEIITVGSDAHYAKDVGADVRKGLEIIYEAGFRHVNYFERRKPYRIELTK
ncbi:MAG: histidinol-phosphatase HisJ family protein [Clostridia bacterium]|nr:histidinol-phosphatase HisJ family protein [Clostridia bacterium]